MGTPERLIDYVADIWVALKGIATELDSWNSQVRSGVITVGARMTTTEATDIPTDNVPCRVDWQDRLGGTIQHSATDTTWSVEDSVGNPTTVVTVEPDVSDTEEETGTCTFHESTGQFKLVASTPGENGEVRAESILYNIVPGSPAVGVITLSPS
jgi:hypothetical protein